MEHTKEPWVLGNGGHVHGSVYEIHADPEGEDWYVAEVPIGLPNVDEGIPPCSVAEANARRIVSCVNAMQGIPDPAAYVAAFDAMQEALDWAIAEIEGRTRYTPNDFYAAEEQRKEARSRARAALSAARIARGGA